MSKRIKCLTKEFENVLFDCLDKNLHKYVAENSAIGITRFQNPALLGRGMFIRIDNKDFYFNVKVTITNV